MYIKYYIQKVKKLFISKLKNQKLNYLQKTSKKNSKNFCQISKDKRTQVSPNSAYHVPGTGYIHLIKGPRTFR